MSDVGDGEEPRIDPGFDLRWLGAYIPDEHWHFHRQLLDRYGIVLRPGEFSRIRREIREGKAHLIEQRRGTSAIYLVRIRSVKQRIFVLATGHRVRTAWPPEKRPRDKQRALRAGSVLMHEGEKGYRAEEDPS